MLVELQAPAVLVVTPGLGTLNHTALTLEAMQNRGIELAGVVIGAWPRNPDLASVSNLHDLQLLIGEPLAGVLPEDIAGLPPAAFEEVAARSLSPRFGGRFEADRFVGRVKGLL
jgi:dethiobiotin synthetase